MVIGRPLVRLGCQLNKQINRADNRTKRQLDHLARLDNDKEADEEWITLRPLASALPRVLVDGRRRW